MGTDMMLTTSASLAGLVSDMARTDTAAAAQLEALFMPLSSSKKKKNEALAQCAKGRRGVWNWVGWDGSGKKGQLGPSTAPSSTPHLILSI
eukprot:4270030-Ditylum_brightwellii.AAC.1